MAIDDSNRIPEPSSAVFDSLGLRCWPELKSLMLPALCPRGQGGMGQTGGGSPCASATRLNGDDGVCWPPPTSENSSGSKRTNSVRNKILFFIECSPLADALTRGRLSPPKAVKLRTGRGSPRQLRRDNFPKGHGLYRPQDSYTSSECQ